MKKRSLSSIPLCAVLFFFIAFSTSCNHDQEKDKSKGQTPWYKNAFIYALEVGTFKDSDGDGRGDLKGLTAKLGYLDSLGVDVIWLAPIMPSPGKDDGFDVTDYYSINPQLGTMADFKLFLREAKKRGIKVILDLVLNHTSDEHPWFKSARADSTSPYRLWYVWSDKRPEDADKGMVFPGVQKETWTFDSAAKKYYFHRFYKFQPDLNYGNPDVQRESFKILQYWLKIGVDGYRLDAVPFIIDLPNTDSDKPERMLKLVAKFRSEVQEVKPDALLLGEANLSPKENKDYFGVDNDGMQMMFNFYANQYVFYGLASEDVKPFIKAIKDTKEKPEAAQWGFFLRNHDEIDLARLTANQRNLIYAKFGPDTNMRLYDRGIRRRLAPMLNNPAQLKMAYSLLFSLPGAPVIRYGEEIGMGDDLSLKERLSVRTPMQWSAGKNAGFSSSGKLFRPVVSLGDYSYKKINVSDEEKNAGSLLNFIKKVIKIRKQYPEIGLGDYTIPESGSDHVFVISYNYKGRSLLTIHNFSKDSQKVTIQLDNTQTTSLRELLTGKENIAVKNGKLSLSIPPYACLWYSPQ